MYDHKVLPDMAGSRPDSTISLVRFDAVKEMDILRVSFGSWKRNYCCRLYCCRPVDSWYGRMRCSLHSDQFFIHGRATPSELGPLMFAPREVEYPRDMRCRVRCLPSKATTACRLCSTRGTRTDIHSKSFYACVLKGIHGAACVV